MTCALLCGVVSSTASGFTPFAWKLERAVLSELDDTTQALVFLGNALFDRIYAPDAAVIMANIYLKKKRGDVSVKTLENALNVYPRNISAWNALSELFLRAGLRDDAIECSKVCAKFDLFATGGSDFHGAGKEETGPGSSSTPPEEFDKMMKYIQI